MIEPRVITGTEAGAPAARPPRPRPFALPVPLAVSAGGVLGALARYGLSLALPHARGAFPWATFLTNVSGCLLIGVLMVLAGEVWAGRRLLRPFLGVGVLGGYTTFSTSVVDVHQAVAAGAPGTALAYLGATVTGALAGVWAGSALTARLLRTRGRRP
ncbi:CrcB family protein [Sphaerisporangium sp. NPDC051011]|uniref:fluoride efflux transporter FluC n=1 Tax=Sphaerisporangium sp. NPDC051011 TaxID=3155792 RepID=UPI0033C80F60